MILSDREIWMEMQTEGLVFEPGIEADQVTPSSVDLRLANDITIMPAPPEGTEIMVDMSQAPDIEATVKAYGTQ